MNPLRETYLQLPATGRDQAEVLVGVLRKNSVKALDYEVPEKPGLFRVRVGPIREGEMMEVRAELRNRVFKAGTPSEGHSRDGSKCCSMDRCALRIGTGI